MQKKHVDRLKLRWWLPEQARS